MKASLKVLMVDDESPARSRLRRLLAQVPGFELAGEADSGTAALARIAELEPDILLLDISMPGLDGMALARTLRGREPTPAVIFCTAHSDRALEAFDCAAVDYLLKPVRLERLQAALEKARRIARPPGTSGEFLYSTVGSHSQLIPLDTVACLVAEDKYTNVYHDGGESLVDDSLADLERAHPGLFLRVHRNALVRISRVRGLDRGPSGVSVLLDNCTFQPTVSRRSLPAVRRLIRSLQ